jgi:hypothetical protein
MIVNLVSLLALLRPLGLPAAAISVTLNHLTSSVILLKAFHRESGMPHRRFWAFALSDWDVARKALGRREPKTVGSPGGL